MECSFRFVLKIFAMEKKDLVKLLNEIFISLDFKRKGNNWVFNGNHLSKLINLQKSNYSNSFYINYGYIIKELELTMERMHVEDRLAFVDKEKQKRITDLLDFEINIPSDQRLTELKTIIIDKIVTKMQLINTEVDLLNELKKRPHLNDISLVVKRYFNLPLPDENESKSTPIVIRRYVPE